METSLEVTRIKDPTRDRYRALSLNSAWKLETIRNASALVIGAGALGNEVGKNLALMGVRMIVIVDRDTVEVANLTRSVFFRESDHGLPKAAVLAERLNELNPEVDILSLHGDVDQVLGLGLVRRMDMIFSCLDNRLARRSINRLCQKVGKAWVDGSMENLLGDVTVYVPDEGPCYECGLTTNDRQIIAEATSCQHIALQNLALGKIPTLSTMGSIISALQVQEALKMLHGITQTPSTRNRLVVNCEINDFYSTGTERKADCEGHFRYGEITEMPQWRVDETSGQEILEHLAQANASKAHLRLGREIVVGLRCHSCGRTEDLGQPMQLLNSAISLCPNCKNEREPITTNVIVGDEPFSEWPLSRLGIPKLDVLEVRGAEDCIWYEMTGDLSSFHLQESVDVVP
jgi:molybdopterin/thiamine biosynthesis adenylyltransferase